MSTPAEASGLNLIAAQFGVLTRFTLTSTDDPTHRVRRRRIARYVRYRNRQVGTHQHPLTRVRSMRDTRSEEP